MTDVLHLQLPTMEWMETGQRIAFTPIPLDGVVAYVPELYIGGVTVRPLREEEIQDIATALNTLQGFREIARRA